MSDQQQKPSRVGKTFKLFLVIFVVLLVPLVMDQAEMDRETVRLAGRIAAGIVGFLFLYGIFSKALKLMGFVVVLLVAFVLLSTEGKIELPRVQALVAEHSNSK